MILEFVAEFRDVTTGSLTGYRTFRERVSDALSFDELVAVAEAFLMRLTDEYNVVTYLESFRVI